MTDSSEVRNVVFSSSTPHRTRTCNLRFRSVIRPCLDTSGLCVKRRVLPIDYAINSIVHTPHFGKKAATCGVNWQFYYYRYACTKATKKVTKFGSR